MNGVAVKVCGLARPEDAAAAESAGAAFGGVILAPASPRRVTPARAREVFGETRLRRCGVVVDADVEWILESADVIGLDVLQLHGDETPELVDQVRRRSGLEVWKAVRPRDAAEFERAVRDFAGVADGLLLDGWSAAARGGTGTRFPWHEVAAHRGVVPPGTTLIAAGGLDAANVAEAIEVLSPDVVDVSSGVEAAPGVKDAARIQAFVNAATAPTAGGRGRE